MSDMLYDLRISARIERLFQALSEAEGLDPRDAQ
jgi:hypothetical protein